MIQGGDITKGDGTGGKSIYGGEFEDENIGWREIDASGLLCMANRGRDTNSSQFFITLAPCEHLNAKHTVFGHLISGQEVLDRVSKVQVDKDDRPLTDVLVSSCGELERQKKRGAIDNVQDDDMKSLSRQSTTSRGRHKRRHSDSQSRSRSNSPSRGHTRRSASRHRHNHRHRRQRANQDAKVDGTDTHSSSRSPTPHKRDRRRSDAEVDHTLRGRPRQRSRSGSPIEEDPRARKRSPEPSRPRSPSPGYRRQRSLPNQYKPHQQRNQAYDDAEEERIARMEWERDGGDRRYDNRGNKGRLGGGYEDGGGRLGGFEDWGGQEESGDGIIYKGRGAMKFREKKKW
jgi:peptidyl-prolyl isomerase G (cyclophilin G)